MDNIVCERLDEHQISDHETIQFKLESISKYRMRSIIKITSWEYYNNEAIINQLRLCDFSNFDRFDLDTKVLNINNNILNAMRSLTYEKEVHLKIMNKWYDSELANMNKNKIELYKLAQISGEWDEYRNIKKNIKSLLKLKSQAYGV